MTDVLAEIELLCGNARAQGDALIEGQNREFAVHARWLQELRTMHTRMGQFLDAEEARFARWLPRETQQVPRESMPRVVAHPRKPEQATG